LVANHVPPDVSVRNGIHRNNSDIFSSVTGEYRFAPRTYNTDWRIHTLGIELFLVSVSAAIWRAQMEMKSPRASLGDLSRSAEI